MAVRSSLLGQLAAPAGANASIFVTPAGRTAIVRTVTVSNVTAAAVTWELYLRSPALLTYFLQYGQVQPANSSRIIDSWFVVPAGWDLRFGGGIVTLAASYVTAHGAMLLGVPT